MNATKSIGTNNGGGGFETPFETCPKNQETVPNTAWDEAGIGKAAADALAAIVKGPSNPQPQQPEPQTSGAVASTVPAGFFLNRPITEKERASIFNREGMQPVSRPGGMFEVASTVSSGFFLNRPITEKERALIFDGPGMQPVSRPGGMFAVGPALQSPSRTVQSPAVQIASISLGIGAVAESVAESALTPSPC